MEFETWKPVPGYEGLYEVSDLGRVRSVYREVPCKIGTRRVFPKILRTPIHKGYRQVNLRGKTRSVHQLVSLAFMGERPKGWHTCHRDGDSLNNLADNLYYGTASDNMQDTLRHGRHGKASRIHCRNGHPFTVENTQLSGGARICRECSRANHLRYRSSKRSLR